MTVEDMKRFRELEKKMDEGIATNDEMYERDALWCALECEEESNRLNTYQFGY